MGQKSGFTIVELLIVVVVIAILAAITIVSYTGIQSKANDAAVQTDFSAMAKKLELYYTDNGKYPVVTSTTQQDNTTTYDFTQLGTALQGYKVTQSAYRSGSNTVNFAYCTNNLGTSYGIAAWSKTSRDQGYSISSVNGNTVSVFPYPLDGGSLTCSRINSDFTRWVWIYNVSGHGGWHPVVR